MWTTSLDPDQVAAVGTLAAACAAADRVSPLNEEAELALAGSGAEHLLHHTGDQLTGYLQWQPRHGSAQLMVAPAHRRRGIGSSLLAGLANRPWLGVWAFGGLPAAAGFAAAHRLAPSRTLLVMSSQLTGVVPSQPPAGFTLRGYTEADAAAFLALNAAAFAHHPEQGSLDLAGLAARTAQPWFDPDGLILGFDADGLAGFHWTKQEQPDVGEVYVIAVAPRAQGHGYGKVLLQAGLAHLRARGAERVLLYVDSAEAVAVRMYESAGFRIAHRDVFYSPARQEQP